MILADPINCTIPSMDVLKTKGQEITCTTSLIDSAKGVELMWIAVAAIGALGSFIVTIFMARYAWKAWKSSQEQVQIAKDQMEQSQKIAIESQRIPSTAEFTRALYTISRHLNFWDVTKEEFKTASMELGASSDKWQLLYGDVFRDGVLFDLISTIQSALSDYAEKWWRLPITENSWPRGERSNEISMISNVTSVIADMCGELLHGEVTEQEFISCMNRLNNDFSNDPDGQ